MSGQISREEIESFRVALIDLKDIQSKNHLEVMLSINDNGHKYEELDAQQINISLDVAKNTKARKRHEPAISSYLSARKYVVGVITLITGLAITNIYALVTKQPPTAEKPKTEIKKVAKKP